MSKQVTKNKNQGKLLINEIDQLIDEFIEQLERETIEYKCYYNNYKHFSKFDLIGRVIKKYSQNHGLNSC